MAYTFQRRGRAVLVPLAALMLLLGACSDDSSAGPERGVDVEDLTEGPDDEAIDADVFEDPAPYGGETVTVSAEVSEVLSDQAFTVAGEDAGGEALLVLRRPDGELVGDENVLRITGTVRLFRGDAEELGLDLDAATTDAIADFEGEYVIVSSSIEDIDPAEGSGADDE